jgi:hypothetical protein
MKLMTLTAALAVTLTVAQTAHARERHYGHAVRHWHGAYHPSGGHMLARRHAAEGEQDWSAWSDRRYQREWSGQSAGEIFGHAVHYRHGAYHPSGRHVLTRRNAAEGEQDRSAWSDRRYQREWSGQSAGEIFAWPVPATYSGGHGGGSGGALGGRPRAWCGWEMRQLVGSDPGPEFNLARNWARWGHAGPAGVGAVVVWAHHVGKIVGQENGQWIIQSGNDGNRVRTRPLSITRAIAVRWG